jgi:hypothetical protein
MDTNMLENLRCQNQRFKLLALVGAAVVLVAGMTAALILTSRGRDPGNPPPPLDLEYPTQAELLGKWKDDFGGTYTFSDGGTFSYQILGAEGFPVRGTYEYNAGTLTGSPLTDSGRVVWVKKPNELQVGTRWWRRVADQTGNGNPTPKPPPPVPAAKSPTQAELLGKWKDDFGGTYTLSDGGTFSYQILGAEGFPVRGTYEYNAGTLTGSPLTDSGRVVWVKKPNELQVGTRSWTRIP